MILQLHDRQLKNSEAFEEYFLIGLACYCELSHPWLAVAPPVHVIARIETAKLSAWRQQNHVELELWFLLSNLVILSS